MTETEQQLKTIEIRLTNLEADFAHLNVAYTQHHAKEEQQRDKINERLDAISKQLSNQRGFIAGAVCVITAVAWALSFLKDWLLK